MGRRKKEVKAFEIPDNILAVIDEVAGPSWALFHFDSLGQFRLHCNFDNPIGMKALKSDITNWVNAMQHIEIQSTLNGIMGGSEDSE